MISVEEIEKLAGLARLRVSGEEVAQLQKDISGILDYVGQLSAYVPSVDTTMKPLVRNVMREDVLRDELDPLTTTAGSLRVAFPRRQGDFNKVRQIIQKDA